MSSGFSPSLTLAGMDYIAPSAVCIKPSMMASGQASKSGIVRHTGDVATTAAGAVTAPGLQHLPDAVKITLQDCLACSGCVTTAETVLVNAQSKTELLRELQDATTLPAPHHHRHLRPWLVTISEQSAAALAAFCETGMTVAEAFSLISGFLRLIISQETTSDDVDSSGSQTNVEEKRTVFVTHLRHALEIATRETAREYARRLQHSRDTLPLITSACPGWVCYCEKQGGALLPHLCPVMSPQGVAGSYAKRVVARDIYHVSIQPCFDRKLEAARDGVVSMDTDGSNAGQDREWKDDEEATSGGGGGETIIQYTDCVLSTAELLEWMLEVDPALPWRGPLDGDSVDAGASGVTFTKGGDTNTARMEGSGGYHRRVMEYMAAGQAQSDSLSPACVSHISYEVKRNNNHQLATCAELPQQVFCVAYGFQQIQNVVRGLKKRMPAMRSYTFVELMACPDGCLNGGGQVRVHRLSPATAAEEQQEEEADDACDAETTTPTAVKSSALTPMQQHAAILQKVEKAFGEYLHVSSPQTLEEEEEEEAVRGCDAEGESKAAEPPLAMSRHEDTAASGAVATLSAVPPLFSRASILLAGKELGPALWSCAFRDRHREFEEMLNDGNVHSLKW